VNAPAKTYGWVTVRTAAEAASISPKLVYAAVRSGECRSIRIGTGRNVRLTLEWLNDWLTAAASGGPNELQKSA